MKKKQNVVVGFLVVAIVIATFVYMIVNKKAEAPTVKDEGVGTVQNDNLKKVEDQKVVTGQEDKKITSNQNNMEGIKITIEKEGTGQAVKSGDTIAVNYTGTFTDGKAFDSESFSL